ncbi:MAG: hypothetical protein ACK4F9_00285 [Brevinematia bacterium]
MSKKLIKNYKIISNTSNLWVYLNLENIKSYEEFESIYLVKQIKRKTDMPFQKLWNFIQQTPMLEAWWKENKIISEFLIDISKVRKIYSIDHIDLFVNERLIPLGILPSIVFDFLGLTSSKEIEEYDSNSIENMKNLNLCKICNKKTYPSEIVEYINSEEGICVYCIESISPEQIREIETPSLFMKRIEETWKAITYNQKQQLVLSILIESRKPIKTSEIQYLKKLSEKISKTHKILEIKEFSENELTKLVKKLDNDYFITWWEKIRW